MSEPTFYELLGLTPMADDAAITAAFRRRSLETHPDKNPDDPEADTRFIAVVKAYQTLSDVHKRAAYDARVLAGTTVTTSSGVTLQEALEAEYFSIMDTPADDVLEEYVVGNQPPADSTLMTFFRDLERTETFVLLRQGKAAYYRGEYDKALTLLTELVALNSDNILAQYFYGMAQFESGQTIKAFRTLKHAIYLGQNRIPARQCPGVRRSLYDCYRRKWCFVSAWLLARSSTGLMWDDGLGTWEREQLRLKRLALEEGIRLQREEAAREGREISDTRALPNR